MAGAWYHAPASAYIQPQKEEDTTHVISEICAEEHKCGIETSGH